MSTSNSTGLCGCGCGRPAPIAKATNRRKGHVKGQPTRFINQHYPGRRGPSGPRRALGDCYRPDEATGCWNWVAKPTAQGYGQINRAGKWYQAHRYVYERLRGPIPEGLELDHLCRNRRCVNPDHLEPVTGLENIRRGRQTRLTIEAVSEIRASAEPHRVLAERYGISRKYVGNLRCGINWAGVGV